MRRPVAATSGATVEGVGGRRREGIGVRGSPHRRGMHAPRPLAWRLKVPASPTKAAPPPALPMRRHRQPSVNAVLRRQWL